MSKLSSLVYCLNKNDHKIAIKIELYKNTFQAPRSII